MDLTSSPGHLNHQFVAEDAATLRPATEMTPNDMNGPMNELVNIILAAQMVPNAGNYSQVINAIKHLIQHGGNYALDTGLADAYVVALNPVITAYTGNFFFSFKALHANAGASTVDFGAGPVALNNDVGGALAAGDITAGMVVSGNYSLADNQARITSMVQSQGDSRYAKVGQVVGKNKLLNTDFENPINQLNKASRVTTAGAYNFDCWYYGVDTKFYQAADYLNLSASQQYTLNWSGTATAEYLITAARSSTIEAQSGWAAIAKGTQIVTPADVISGAKFLWIRWTGVTAALATFDKPQLEPGVIATNHEFKWFLDRLRECEWYYEQSYAYGTTPGTAGAAGPYIKQNDTSQSGIVQYRTDTVQVYKRFPPAVTIYSYVTGAAGYVSSPAGDTPVNSGGSAKNVLWSGTGTPPLLVSGGITSWHWSSSARI